MDKIPSLDKPVGNLFLSKKVKIYLWRKVVCLFVLFVPLKSHKPWYLLSHILDPLWKPLMTRGCIEFCFIMFSTYKWRSYWILNNNLIKNSFESKQKAQGNLCAFLVSLESPWWIGFNESNLWNFKTLMMSIKVSNTKLNKLYEWIRTPCFELLIQSFFHFVSCFYPENLIIYVKNISRKKKKGELQWKTCWKTIGEGRGKWVVVLQICESNIRNATKKHTWLREGVAVPQITWIFCLIDFDFVLFVGGLLVFCMLKDWLGCILFIGELITCVLFVGELIACVLVVVVIGGSGKSLALWREAGFCCLLW